MADKLSEDATIRCLIRSAQPFEISRQIEEE